MLCVTSRRSEPSLLVQLAALHSERLTTPHAALTALAHTPPPSAADAPQALRIHAHVRSVSSPPPCSTMSSSAAAPSSSQSWQSQSLRAECECHSCQQGITRELHSHGSHDQSLYSSIEVHDTSLQIVGGTTKCARVFITLLQHPEASTHPAITQLVHSLANTSFRSCVELGAGTGLISMCLALLGGDVIATDQQPSMEMLEHNLEQNQASIQAHLQTKPNASALAKVRLQAQPLLWGDDEMTQHILEVTHPTPAPSYTPLRCIVGSDLIYAKENITALVSTYAALAMPYLTECYLVYIPRFEWEQQFFVEMQQQHFSSEKVYEVDEIQVWRFVKTLDTENNSCRTILERACTELQQATAQDSESDPTNGNQLADHQLHTTTSPDAASVQHFSAQTYIASVEPLTTILLQASSVTDGAIEQVSKMFFGNFANYIEQSSTGRLPLCFHIAQQQQIVAALVAHPYKGPPPASFRFPPQLAVLNQYILPLLEAQRAGAPSNGQIIRIAAVAVDPAYQRRGLATLLLRSLMQCVAQHNARVAGTGGANEAQTIKSVLVETTSARLSSICASLGFSVVAEVSYSADHLQALSKHQQGQRQVPDATRTRLMIAQVMHV